MFLSACDGDEGASVLVELRTDFVSGVEFAAVQTTLADPVMNAERTALLGDDYVGSRRVAEFGDVPLGDRLLTVRLIDVSGDEVASRQVRFVARATTGIPVIIARSCLGVSCSADQACSGGRCVSPLCIEEGERVDCAEPECSGRTDCAAMSTCTEPRCQGGLCLYAASTDACAAGQYCDVASGCQPVPGDSGAPASVTLVQSAGAWDTSSVLRRSASFDTPPTAGNTIVVSISTSFQVVTRVTDTAGNAYVGVPSNPTMNSPTYCNTFVYYASDIVTAPDLTVNVVAENPDRLTFAVHELSRGDASGPLAGDIRCSDNGPIPSCGPPPLSTTPTAHLATLCHNRTRTTTFDAPFLIAQAPTESGDDNSALVTAFAPGASVEARAMLSSSDDWQMILTAFR